MTNTHDAPDLTDLLGDQVDNQPEWQAPGDLEPSAAERLAWRRRDAFLPDEDWHPDRYPAVRSTSAAFVFNGIVRPLARTHLEYAAIALGPGTGDEENTKAAVTVAKWNMLAPTVTGRPEQPTVVPPRRLPPFALVFAAGWLRRQQLATADAAGLFIVVGVLMGAAGIGLVKFSLEKIGAIGVVLSLLVVCGGVGAVVAAGHARACRRRMATLVLSSPSGLSRPWRAPA